jgi:hypothetical protein
MEGTITIFILLNLAFAIFCVYFIFKIIEFVISAIKLYKDMIIRQDVMIKLLQDIKDGGGSSSVFVSDGKYKETIQQSLESTEKAQDIQDTREVIKPDGTVITIIDDKNFIYKAPNGKPINFKKMNDEYGTTNCKACKKRDEKNKMFYAEAINMYYHKECLF